MPYLPTQSLQNPGMFYRISVIKKRRIKHVLPESFEIIVHANTKEQAKL
jgi:hypothetical protein